MATFMVASNVRFLDDTSLGHVPMNQEAVTGGNGSLEPQESVFYLSRLNDPTTYFFTWVCKRYRLTVKSEPHNCPICLETGENNIQLSCGHTFCRQCLKAAAEREMTSCALCRKSHTLDPDVLRAQFDQQRVANMSWRLGQTRAARAFSKPSWEATAAVASPHTAVVPGGGAKDMLLGSSSSAAGGGGGGAGCVADEDDVKKTPSSTVPSSPKHDGPDIGALPRSLLLRRARSSVKRALLNRDAGGAAPCELRERWTKLMGGQRAAAVLPSDVGGVTIAEMKGRWAALLAGQAAAGADVGAATVGEVRKRWREEEEEDGAAGECGAASVEELGARWRALSTHFVTRTTVPPVACVGAAPAAVLKAAWEGTARVGAIGRDVGAAAAELTKPVAAAALALAPECGATPVPALALRLRAAQQLGLLPVPSMPSAPSAASVLPEECGALPQHALSGQWASLLAPASCGGPDVGSLPLRALAGRWEAVSPAAAAGSGDVGAAATGGLEGRWRGTMAVALGQDVGAETVDGLRQRWRAALAV